jgi:hypothetical protein
MQHSKQAQQPRPAQKPHVTSLHSAWDPGLIQACAQSMHVISRSMQDAFHTACMCTEQARLLLRKLAILLSNVVMTHRLFYNTSQSCVTLPQHIQPHHMPQCDPTLNISTQCWVDPTPCNS